MKSKKEKIMAMALQGRDMTRLVKSLLNFKSE